MRDTRDEQMPFSIRPLRVLDGPDLEPLCAQLGYPSTRDQITRRLEAILARESQGACGVFGALSEERMVGWVHVESRYGLETDAAAEVCSLVVLESLRGKGIGRALLQRAEQWAQHQKLAAVWLRSSVARFEAHAFYMRLGYATTKTSHLFSKALVVTSGAGET